VRGRGPGEVTCHAAGVLARPVIRVPNRLLVPSLVASYRMRPRSPRRISTSPAKMLAGVAAAGRSARHVGGGAQVGLPSFTWSSRPRSWAKRGRGPPRTWCASPHGPRHVVGARSTTVARTAGQHPPGRAATAPPELRCPAGPVKGAATTARHHLGTSRAGRWPPCRPASSRATWRSSPATWPHPVRGDRTAPRPVRRLDHGPAPDAGGVHVTFARSAPRPSTWSSGPTGCTRGAPAGLRRSRTIRTVSRPVADLGLYVSIFGVPGRYGWTIRASVQRARQDRAVFSAPGPVRPVAQFFSHRAGRATIEFDYRDPAHSRRSWPPCSLTSAGTCRTC